MPLPRGLAALRVSRAVVGRVLGRRRIDHPVVVQGAALVVTELVANAIQHAGAAQRLTVCVEHLTVMLAVDDRSAVVPRMRLAGEDGGFGLLLIDAVAIAWGADLRPGGGKRVWARLATLPPHDTGW